VRSLHRSPTAKPTPLSALRAGAKQLRGPQVTVDRGPSEPCYATAAAVVVVVVIVVVVVAGLDMHYY